MLPVNGRGQSRRRYQIEYEVCFRINVYTNKAGLTFSSDVSSGIDFPSTPELNLSVDKMEKHDPRT